MKHKIGQYLKKIPNFAIVRVRPFQQNTSVSLPTGMTRISKNRAPRSDVQNLHAAALKGRPWAVDKLKDRIRHFPKYPVFKNLLFTAYFAKNNLRAAREVAEQMYREHPEYVYARTNLAECLIKTGDDIHRVK